MNKDRSKNETPRLPDCIRCGRCLQVCEMRLEPALLFRYSRAGLYDDCRRFHIDRCSDCGECAFVCPARIPLFQYIRVAHALSVLRERKSALIPVLLEVQANFGYLPQGIIRSISEYLSLPEGHIRSVASFYRKLRLLPPGRLRFTVCRGTACHIRGAPRMLDELEKTLGIKDGETSPDKEYTLDTVACIGCCAQAPCIMVNNKVYSNMTPEKIKGLLGKKGERNA